MNWQVLPQPLMVRLKVGCPTTPTRSKKIVEPELTPGTEPGTAVPELGVIATVVRQPKVLVTTAVTV